MPRKKVLWIIKGLGRGGAERLLESSIPYFNRTVYDYEVVYFLPHKNDVVPVLKQANIPVFCVNIKFPLDILGLWRLQSLLRERRPDILHIHLPYAGILGRVAGRMAGVKNIVYTEHNIMEKYHPLTRLFNLATYSMNNIAIAVSEEVKHSMERYRLSKHTRHIVIKNGIDLVANDVPGDAIIKTREALGIPATYKIVGNVAHIRPEKGHEYLLQAAKIVVDRYPEITFVIVGREKTSGEIKRLEGIAKELGIKQNVIFTGFRQDVAALVSIFDVFVLSSLAEGLPLALLEAMVRGKPPVATAVGGIPEVIEDGVNGLLVPPKDPQAIATKIIQLLEDQDLRVSISANAVRTVKERFGIQEMIKKVEAVYSDILAR
jgi:glycosyltransferase involved in cell wall biosynthesis